MRHLRVQVRRQVDNGDGFEWASFVQFKSCRQTEHCGNVLFDTNTTTYAQELRYERNLIC